MPGASAHIGKQFGRQDVEALFRHRLGTAGFGIGIAQACVVEIRRTGLALLFVEVAGQVFRNEAVEQHAEHVGLEIPSIDAAAQIVGDAPDGLVQFRAFVFFVVVRHLVLQSFLFRDLCRQEQQQRIIWRDLETETAIVPGCRLIERIDE